MHFLFQIILILDCIVLLLNLTNINVSIDECKCNLSDIQWGYRHWILLCIASLSHALCRCAIIKSHDNQNKNFTQRCYVSLIQNTVSTCYAMVSRE